MAYPTGSVHLEVEGAQPAQLLAGLVAMAFVLIGGIGLLRTAGVDGVEVTVLGLTLDALRSWIYIGLGLLGLVETITSATSRAFGWLLFVGCGSLFVWGLMLNDLTAANLVARLGDPLGLTVADGWWHLVFAVVGLVMAVIPAHKVIYLGSVRAGSTRDSVDMDATDRSLLPPSDFAV